jgi:hypothetical protein
MWPQLLAAIFGIVDKVIPDPQAAAAAKLEAMKLQASAEGASLEAATRLALAQVDVNKADANGQSAMQRNGRPFILWVCGIALAFDTIAKPVAVYAATIAGHPLPPMPNLSSDQLYSLLFGILGLGGLRTMEKVKGAA